MKIVLWCAAVVILFGLIVGVELSHHGSFEASSTASTSNVEATSTVTINGTSVAVDVAVTPAQQQLGLGGRTSLAPDTGMLFVFPADGVYAFWMKDMQFPIDILWLQDDGAVVYVVPDLSPSTYPSSYAPRTPARYVLELPAGFAAAHHVKLGDIVTLPY